jgi:hypothetical protein
MYFPACELVRWSSKYLLTQFPLFQPLAHIINAILRLCLEDDSEYWGTLHSPWCPVTCRLIREMPWEQFSFSSMAWGVTGETVMGVSYSGGDAAKSRKIESKES